MAIEFEIWAYEPDTTQEPTLRWGQNFDALAIAPWRQFIQWPETDAQLSFAFRFSFVERNPLLAAKDFFSRHGGMSQAFLLPSWQRDITPAEIPAPGAVTIEVEGTDWLDAYPIHHPDGPGRYGFVFCPVNGFHAFRITNAEPESPSTTLLTIEQPIPWTAEEESIWGWLYCVRFAEDEMEWMHSLPQRCTIEPGFIQTRQRIEKDETAYAEGIQIYASQPITSVVAERGEPPVSRFDVAYAWGPKNGRVVQNATFETRWAAWIATDGIRLGKYEDGEILPPDDGEGFLTDLFTEAPDTTHLSLCFDQNGWEVIAWQHSATVAKIRRRVNYVLTEYTFPGLQPVMFFNGNVAVQDRLDGESDVVVYYRKAGESVIFARYQRNNFAVEYIAAGVPFLPIYLMYADHDAEARTMEVVYLDNGWRTCRAVCDAYPEPPEIPPDPYVFWYVAEEMSHGAEITASSSYDYGIIFPPDPDGLLVEYAGNSASLPLSDDMVPVPLSAYENAGTVVPNAYEDVAQTAQITTASAYSSAIVLQVLSGEATVHTASLTASTRYELAIADGGILQESMAQTAAILSSSFYAP